MGLPQCATKGPAGQHPPTLPPPVHSARPHQALLSQTRREGRGPQPPLCGCGLDLPYCATPNSRGGPLHQLRRGPRRRKPVNLVQDTPPAPAPTPPAAATPARPWWRQPWRWVLATVLALMTVMGWMYTHTRDTTVNVSQRSWAREVQVEQFMPLSQTAWCDSLPADAYNVSHSRAQRSTRQVPMARPVMMSAWTRETEPLKTASAPHATAANRCMTNSAASASTAGATWARARLTAPTPPYPSGQPLGPAPPAHPWRLWSEQHSVRRLQRAALGAQREGSRSERYELVLSQRRQALDLHRTGSRMDPLRRRLPPCH